MSKLRVKKMYIIVHSQIPVSFIVYQVIVGDDRYLWFFKIFYSIYKFIFFGQQTKWKLHLVFELCPFSYRTWSNLLCWLCKNVIYLGNPSLCGSLWIEWERRSEPGHLFWATYRCLSNMVFSSESFLLLNNCSKCIRQPEDFN